MGATRIAVYLVGLLLVVAAAWVFLTQTDLGRSVPTGFAIALILLLVGIGVMASAKSINDSRYLRRVVHDAPVPPPRVYDTAYEARYGTAPAVPPDGETIVEERRYD